MRLLTRLERAFKPFAIPNLALYLIVGQGICWALINARPELTEHLLLIPAKVIQGEFWRLFAFLFMPPAFNPIFLFFAFYMFWLMSNALEQQWGTVRFNLYVLLGYLMAIGSSFIVPGGIATNAFLEGSIFLAFAFLYPNFQIYIFFILPIRIKWLALLTWIGYGFVLLFGSWMERVLVLAAIANFLLFFWGDIIQRVSVGRHHMKSQITRIKQSSPDKVDAFHTCASCGITDRTHPTMEFRYCSDCKPAQCFCMEHLTRHQHQRQREIISLK